MARTLRTHIPSAGVLRRLPPAAAMLLIGSLWAAPSFAQRPTFPTPVQPAPAAATTRPWDPYASSGFGSYPPTAAGYPPATYPPATYPPATYPPATYPPAGTSAVPTTPYAAPPSYPAAPSYPAGSVVPGYPSTGTPPVYTPSAPYPPPPGYPPTTTYPAPPAYPPGYPAQPYPTQPQSTSRFESLSLLTTYIPDLSDNGSGLGVTEVDVNLAFKMRFPSPEAPLYISPGFAFHFWDGPDDYPLGPRTYDAYVNFAWRPMLGRSFGLDLGFTPSLSTDFENTSSDMWRFQAKALGIVALTPRSQFVLGVYYLDRLDIKLLPAGGLIWTPNDDARFEIFFPRPKIAFRLPSGGTHEYWWYIAGEYGGGSWAVKLDNGDNSRFDYNDIRVYTGIQWQHAGPGQGFIEIGYVGFRELDIENLPDFDPNDSLMLRAGISF